MLPFVLGGIAIAAVGYVLKEYSDKEGFPWDESTSPKDEQKKAEDVTSSTKQSYQEALLELGKLLKIMEEGKEIDIFTSYAQAPQKEIPEEMIEKIGEEEYIRSCTDMLVKVEEIAEYYQHSILKLFSPPVGEKLSKVEVKMIKYAFKFYRAMQELLPLTYVDEEGNVTITSKEAFLRYEKVIIKHKMKISFFRVAEHNYTLFLTASEGVA